MGIAKRITKRRSILQKMRLRKRTPVYALFNNIRSLYNVGAMFRTSDAALVAKIFLTGQTGKPPRKEIDKSALGATDVVPWEYYKDGAKIIRKLKKQKIHIVALEQTSKSISYCSYAYRFPICLVVGNEINGVSSEILDLCDSVIDIPMLGRAKSLNVATAYGIALFEILKQYHFKHA